MVDDPPSTKWTTSTHAKLPRGLPFSYRNELHRVPARVWLGKRREYVRRACTSSLRARPPPTWVCVRDTNLDIMRRPSPCLRPVRPPVTTMPDSSSPYLSSFSLHFYIQGATIKITICRYTRPLTLIDAILMVFASLLAKEDINYPLHACGSF